MKTVVITGATGFIGSALCKKLLEDQFTVYGIGRNKQVLSDLAQNERFVPLQLGFEEYSQLPSILENTSIDCFYHLAWLAGGAYSSDIDVQMENVRMSCEAIKNACKVNAKKILMAGSYYEFKLRSYDNCEIEKVYDSIFGIAKTCAIEMCRNLAFQQNISFVSAYIPKIFGPGDKPSSAPVKIINQLLKNQPVKLIKGEQYDDWIYIDDIVEGLLAVANCPSGRYYVGNRRWRPFREICQDMKEALNSSSELLFGEYNDSSYIDFSIMQIDKLYKETGFECTCDFKESVRKLANWIKAN